MIIKKCTINLHKEEVIDSYTRTIDGNFEIYEKTENNYVEVVAKNLGTTDIFIDTPTGAIVNTSFKEDENFVVYPNTSINDYISLNNKDNATVTYTQELTQIS